MRTSGYDRVRIYFDPDAMKYKRPLPDGRFEEGNVFFTNPHTPPGQELQNPVSKYKISFINVDRQKAEELEIIIEDARGTGYFPATNSNSTLTPGAAAQTPELV